MKRNILIGILIFTMLVSTACTTTKTDIKRAADWEEEYPYVYKSFLDNSEMVSTTYGGSVPVDYLEQYPYLKTFYDGYGFSIEYKRARGHVYGVEDVINTERPKPGASCFSCKTSDFIQVVEKEGVSANSINFEEFAKEYEPLEGISCFDCHRNEPGVINITREHLNVGLEHLEKEFPQKDMVCGQCHVEYYLDPETKEVILPWENGADTDGMIDYYDSIDFFDWEHPTTGSKLLKAQHPEFETFNGGPHNDLGLNCVTCHMPPIEADNREIKSHHWTSPLKTIESSCLGCHSNETSDTLTMKVEDIQGEVAKKTEEVSGVILQLIEELTDAVESGNYTDVELDQVRDLHRKAQFKWDFVFVENGEGFHNPDLAHKNLDEALELANQALEILK